MSDKGDEIAKFQLERRKLEIAEQQTLKKWMESNDSDLILKAHLHLEDVEKRQSSGLKTIIFDPENRMIGDGYLRKQQPLTFQTLRNMSKVPIIAAIIKTRVEQVSEFCQPQSDKFQPGFIIRKKKKSYFNPNVKEEAITKELQGRIDEMVEFLMNCGEESNIWHGDTFQTLTRKIIPDSLSLDQACFEVVRNRKGIPMEVIAADGATMRIADSYEDDEYQGNKVKLNGYYPSYVQVIDGQVKNEYYPWELCFGIRNQNTSIYNNGYGSSELEELMQIVTWMLNSDTYNGKFFSQGSAPKGIIKVSGNVNGARLQEFRQSWQATVASVMNSHKVPVIESDNFEWIDLQRNNRDMEFSQWQEYLIKVACSIYKIDPSEVFDLQHTNSNKLGGTGKEENVQYSKDKGLKPLLRNYQAWINKYIVNPRDPELEFIFVGLDADSEKAELEMDIKKAQTYMGLNEIRSKHNMGELDPNDIILNPIWMQSKQMQQMQQMGNAQSNQFVDQMSQDGQDQQDYQKSEDSNPFIKELNSFVKRTLTV